MRCSPRPAKFSTTFTTRIPRNRGEQYGCGYHGNASERCCARAGLIRGGVSLLAQARLYQLRRADGTDRDHASRIGRAPALDLGTSLSACPELLHGVAGAGGATARDLYRLVD